MKIIIGRPTSRDPSDTTIDMTADGRFVERPRPTLTARIFRAAIVIATLAAGFALAALALWFALMLIPIALAAGAIAWAAWRWQLWRAPRRY